MATKQQVLGKIADLLKDINNQFDNLENDTVAGDGLKTDLFEATVTYFAANVAVYNKLEKAESGALEEPIQEVEDNLEDPSDVDGDTETDVDTETADSDEIVFTPGTEDAETDTSPEGESEVDEIEVDEPEIDTDVPSDSGDGAYDEGNDEGDDEPVDDNDDDITTNAADEVAEAAAAPHREPVVEEAEVEEESEATESEDETIAEEVVIEQKAVEIDAVDTPSTSSADDEKPARPLSLNERLSAQRKAGSANPLMAAQHDGERISDIKSAISLNDKLLFIKDLFNGYSLAYSEAIELLNRYDDFVSADGFLQSNYAQKNNWANKPETVDKLYAILRKRFG
ncbi:hypothetical protein [Parapedobacter sp. 10938]|uniref:hypothetical protein n=1 Tax=Parapedobacter flavus TaxID=3110225 RepID=UPI002DBECA35|nr:hypothetical protein [Parapedobacter sp. 10938]MEC3878655.1 hypothetical protein [Parapedobacter sp. 10938]